MLDKSARGFKLASDPVHYSRLPKTSEDLKTIFTAVARRMAQTKICVANVISV
jgi:hypothetical protein